MNQNIQKEFIEMLSTSELSKLYWKLEKNFTSADRTVVKFAVKGCKPLCRNYYLRALLALGVTEADYAKTFVVTLW